MLLVVVSTSQPGVFVMTAYRALIRPSGEDAMGRSCILDPPPGQGDARSSTDACLSWQKVQRREANRRRHRLTEPTTKALCQTPPPPIRGTVTWPKKHRKHDAPKAPKKIFL